MITLQRFNEDNPPTVAQLNVYFESMASAINALSGQQVIQFLGPADDPNLYAPIAGASFTGAITAPSETLGNPLLPVPTVTISDTAPSLGTTPDLTATVPRLWYNPADCRWYIWHLEDGAGCWAEIGL